MPKPTGQGVTAGDLLDEYLVADSPDLHADRQIIAGVPLWRLSGAAWGLQHEAAI